MQVFFERRKRRSMVAQEALDLQLKAAAKRSGAEAMVLADSHGLVVAETGRSRDGEEIAAFSPYLATHHPWTGTIRCEGGLRTVAISPFKLGPDKAYLCAVGVKKNRVGSAFLHATAGVRRILSR